MNQNIRKNVTIAPKPSARKQAQGALDQLAEIQKMLPKFIFTTNQAISTVQNQLSHLTEVVNALVRLQGEEHVAEAVQQARIEKAVLDAEDRKQQVAKALEIGRLQTEETVRPAIYDEAKKDAQGNPIAIEPGSYVASVEFTPDGQEVPGSYFCLPMAKIKTEFQKSLEGKKAGDEVPSETQKDEAGNDVLVDGKPVQGKIVVLGVYKLCKVDQKKVDEIIAASPEEQATRAEEAQDAKETAEEEAAATPTAAEASEGDSAANSAPETTA